VTPAQKIKWAILIGINEPSLLPTELVTGERVDELYDEAIEQDLDHDTVYEFSSGEVETSIPSESSRHYESKSVAAKMPDGSWVGWTYWYGGGKHGEPEAIEWIEGAYDLDLKEEMKMVLVREFTKKE